MYDCIIIGGGPAGLTAGIYTARANLKTLIFEKESIGGQISSSPLVENYPGFKSISGMELANNLYEQVLSLGGEVEFDEVTEIIPGKIKTVKTSTSEYQSKAVIIATGATHRLLGLERESKYLGSGISLCATCDGAFFKNRVVAVIGGANSAVTNALYLSNLCKKVYLIYRGEKLKCEGTLLEKVENTPNIEILYNSNVTDLIGDDTLKGIVINNDKTIEIDGMFEYIGMNANTELVKNLLDLTDTRYIPSTDTRTKCDGIFVAGDVRDKSIRQLTTATSDGTIAAMLAIDYLK